MNAKGTAAMQASPAASTVAAAPLRVVVMGVSGCGKSTMAAALGQALHLEMVDGDDLHLPHSVAKMSAGIALDDADRWPWLDRIADYLAQQPQQPQPPQGHAGRVVACSALKRAYRDRIRQQVGQNMLASGAGSAASATTAATTAATAATADVRFVFLQGDFEVIQSRMLQRVGHYMQPALLQSQFEALEPPQPDEAGVITLSITEPVEALLAQACAQLRAGR